MKNEMILAPDYAVVAKSEDPLKMQPVIIIKRGSTSGHFAAILFCNFGKITYFARHPVISPSFRKISL